MNYLINLSEKGILENAGDRIPIGLLSMASQRNDTRVIDLNHYSESDLMIDIYKNKPENIGISVYTSAHYTRAVELARLLRRNFNPRLIAGGYHATAMPESLKEFNAVVVGEGENGFNESLERDGIIHGKVPSLDSLKQINFNLIDLSNYGMTQSGKRAATLITSRGCPYSCGFCGKMSSKVRYEPVKHIKEQIDWFFWQGFEGLYFLDDVFTLNQTRMHEIVQHAHHKGLPFRVTTRANLIDDSRLEVLADNGCEWISLGIESGDNGILKKSNKGLTAEQNYNAVRSAKKYGIKVKGFFILGLPGETEETARRTIDFSHLLKFNGLTQADFYYLTPFPGTPIWNNPDKFGIEIVDKDYTKYLLAGIDSHCYVNTTSLKAERIEELVRSAKESWK